MRANVSVGLRYLDAWLGGLGAVAIDDLMEDVATAEISRSQLWQWRRHGVRTAEGTLVDGALLSRLIDEACATLESGDSGNRNRARRDKLPSREVDAKVHAFESNGAQQRHLARPREDNDGGRGAIGGIDQRKTHRPLENATLCRLDRS